MLPAAFCSNAESRSRVRKINLTPIPSIAYAEPRPFPSINFSPSPYKLKSGLEAEGRSPLFFSPTTRPRPPSSCRFGFVRRTKLPGGAGSLRFGFVLSSANPRPGAPLLSWVCFFNSRIRLALPRESPLGFVFQPGRFSSRGCAIKQLPAPRSLTSEYPPLELGEAFFGRPWLAATVCLCREPGARQVYLAGSVFHPTPGPPPSYRGSDATPGFLLCPRER
jgi:hypothetical protein